MVEGVWESEGAKRAVMLPRDTRCASLGPRANGPLAVASTAAGGGNAPLPRPLPPPPRPRPRGEGSEVVDGDELVLA